MSVIILGHKYSIANVTYLDLENRKLKMIPPEVMQLKNLNTINLSRNLLKDIPIELIMLPKLTSLDMSDNLLNRVPTEILQTKLQYLYIYSNPMDFMDPKMYQNNLPEIRYVIDMYLKLNKIKEMIAGEKIKAFVLKYYVNKSNDELTLSI